MRHHSPHIRLSILAVLLTISVDGWSQTDSCKNLLNIGLNFMTHGEIRSGGLPRPLNEETIIEDRANFLIGRSRLSINYQRPGLEGRVVVQNQSVWGQKGNTAVTLYEGWAKLTAPIGLFAQIGRIPLAYDDERIIGPNDWAMASSAHDVLRLGYQGHGHQAHILLAYNQNPENMNTGTYYTEGTQPYKTMQVMWYHYDVPKVPFGTSLLFMNIGMQAGTIDKNPHTEFQQLLGGYLKFHPKHWQAEASYYRQFGYNEKQCRIDAWMASGKVQYMPTDIYGFGIGYDYLSGDSFVPVTKPGNIGLPQHKVYQGFSTIYGSHHQFYGVMDYFYQSAYINGFTPGLQNAFVEAFCNPFSPLMLKASYHYMAITTHLKDQDMTLGYDFEAEASYRFSKSISLSAGFSFMRGGETMNNLKQGKGSNTVRWGWFSLIISPNLFTTKW